MMRGDVVLGLTGYGSSGYEFTIYSKSLVILK